MKLVLSSALAGILLTASASSPAIPPPLEPVFKDPDRIPLAAFKAHQLQLWVESGSRRWRFEATWEHPRAQAQDFHYASTGLIANEISPAQTSPQKGWERVTVLPESEAQRLFHAAADQLVPSKPGQAVYCGYAFGDALLFRNPQGQVQLSLNPETQPGISIVQRYGRQELASVVAGALAARLQASYPSQTAFLLPLGTADRFRLAFLDLKARRAVVLYVPRPGADPAASWHPGLRLSNLASFILVDQIYTFLKNPVTASTRTLNHWVQWPLTVLGPRRKPNLFANPPLNTGPGMDLVAWEHWLDRHTKSRRELGSVQLLIDGDRFYPALEHRLAQARTNVSLHVCIFDSDDVAVQVADHLKQIATNVPVKVAFDRLMSRGAGKSPPGTPLPDGFLPPQSIAAALRRDSNVRVRPKPNPGFTFDHSKIIVVDGSYAFIGGMNIGREYRFEWHDLMAELQGPVVASFQRELDRQWDQLGPWGDLALAADYFLPDPPLQNRSSLLDQIELRRLYTRSFDHQIRRAQLAAINRASSYVFAENPYFFNNDVLIALAQARSRGADVRVVLSSENDLGLARKSALVAANYLLDYGVRVYFYPGMTHVKAMIADGWVCFGSANFDALSLRLNHEANIASSDPVFANEFRQQLFDADFARSRELKQPLSVEWSDYLADSLLTPF
jgi:cardiolipin synthase A/B